MKLLSPGVCHEGVLLPRGSFVSPQNTKFRVDTILTRGNLRRGKPLAVTCPEGHVASFVPRNGSGFGWEWRCHNDALPDRHSPIIQFSAKQVNEQREDQQCVEGSYELTVIKQFSSYFKLFSLLV
jgi:hypothetical protein